MRKVAFLLTAALAFGLLPFTGRLGPVPSALALVGLGVLLSLAASGAASSIAVGAGALGAFAGGMLAATSPAAAGAALAALCFGERSLRVRSQSARALHVAVALVGGALAGSLTTAFAISSPAVRSVAVTVAAVLLALPLLIDADDPLAHALDAAAAETSGPAAASLREAAELRRAVDEDLLDPSTSRRVRETWTALLRLAEARVRLSRSLAARRRTQEAPSHADAVIKKVDQRLGDHVAALARAYTAVDTARAAEASIDDAALREVESAGESLEQVSRAIVDEV